MLLKVLKTHYYIISYRRVSHGIPRGLIQTLMGTTLDDKPTIHQPHQPSLRFSTDPVEESRQLRDQAKVVGPNNLADEVVLDGALKTQPLVDIDH